jgi:hypothetical protein
MLLANEAEESTFLVANLSRMPQGHRAFLQCGDLLDVDHAEAMFVRWTADVYLPANSKALAIEPQPPPHVPAVIDLGPAPRER